MGSLGGCHDTAGCESLFAPSSGIPWLAVRSTPKRRLAGPCSNSSKAGTTGLRVSAAAISSLFGHYGYSKLSL